LQIFLTAFDFLNSRSTISLNVPTNLTSVLGMDPRMPTELRHAYRALLRAVTYLPDAPARAYLHSYVVQRFRSRSDKINFRSKLGHSSEDLIKTCYEAKRIGKARQAARQLERAGQGSLRDLKKVLLLTYGRIGKRRRELMAELIRPDESSLPPDQQALEKLIRKIPEGITPRFSPDSKVLAFLRDQRANQPRETSKLLIRHGAPRIPEENSWGRPIPRKLQKSIVRRFWASTLGRILPPIPEHEWNRLRDLATGAAPIEEPPPRRSGGHPRPLADGENDSQLLKYFATPANLHTSDLSEIKVDPELGATCWVKPFRDVKILRAEKHTVTRRYMRRLYATIWNMTATMSRDEATKTWIIKWGGTRSAANSGQISAPNAKDMEFFEGLDEAESGTRDP
jgi:hypothetical protein